MFTRSRISAAFVLCASISTAAIAQDSVRDFGQLRDHVRKGDTVYVTDTSGREAWMPVRHAGAAELERLINQLRNQADDISRIEVEHSDSLWNGMLLGLAAAGTPWLITCAMNEWCYYNEYGAENLLRTTALTTAAVGAGIGALWDRSVKKKIVLYDRPAKIHISPQVSRQSAGIWVSATF
jgi:hypothetical protein